MAEQNNGESGSSPASRGGAGVYIEGELGAYYLLALLAGTEPRGMPGTKLTIVRFQGIEQGYAMDDLILEGISRAGDALLEIQSKRTIAFTRKDATFAEVAVQIARTQKRDLPDDRHLLAVATQRQSKSISGPYQDVLLWAKAAESGRQFFDRVGAKGVASDAMRTFVATFRSNLLAAGVVDDDNVIWKLMRRFAILVFDFESIAPLARLHALALAQQVLADEDISRAESLWSELIEISISIAKVGGAINRDELRAKLVERGVRLAGDRDYRPARARLADLARMTLADIGTTVGGVTLTRHEAVDGLNAALEGHRFIELRGGPGVGKSGVLKLVAERVGRESVVIVLDQLSTPSGGWLSFSQAIGVPGTAGEFFNDLAASGGGLIVIDGLEMFSDPGSQRTVNELLREASAVTGFSVIATARATDDANTSQWIADDVIDAFGGIRSVSVGELTDEEVETLSDGAPELRAILASGHPAANISRNLYRLSRLLKVPLSADIRTEVALASQWWATADNAPDDAVKAGQRIIAELAEISLNGGNTMELRDDSAARTHLIGSLTLTEPRRDKLAFYHDVLRDWGIGNYIDEDHNRFAKTNVTVPASPWVARGVEFAARLSLEKSDDGNRWLSLLDRFSPAGAHSSWRRHALLAIVRSEVADDLLERCSGALLARGGALFTELVTVIAAVDTISTEELYTSMEFKTSKPVPKSFRTNITGTGYRLLKWVLAHRMEIPIHAISAVIDLVKLQILTLQALTNLGSSTATMLFGWLGQLDVRDADITIPTDSTTERMESGTRRRMIEDLRSIALMLSALSPNAAKAYLQKIDADRDTYKVKAIRQFSSVVASAAPVELANLVANSLIEPRSRKSSSYGGMRDRVFSFADSDYLPASPAQPPFLDLLSASPENGLALVRRLVSSASEAYSEGTDPGENGFTLVFDDGPRFFPWTETYLWSRDQAREYSVASGLKALEAWSQKRLDNGEPVDAVVADILGPEGSCSAYLLVAIDVLLSHFDEGREALVPFLACPELLAIDKTRAVHDQVGNDLLLFGEKEPSGLVTLADLRERPSRGTPLSNALIAYLQDDEVGNTLRNLLVHAASTLEPYATYSDFADARFAGRHALNYLDLSNWKEIKNGQLMYQSPSNEAAHLAQMQAHGSQLAQTSEKEARIDLAIDGGEYATTETARLAVEYAAGDLPDESDTDVLKSCSTRLTVTALLVARDGEDDLLESHEDWVREVIRRALEEEKDHYSGSQKTLRFNRPAIGALALLHLWRRRGLKKDRDKLVSIAAQRNRANLPAFAAALSMIAEKDPRLFKAAMRAAFAGFVWRWHPHNEDDAVQKCFEKDRDATVQEAVAAEVAWLDGAEEPAWPTFPDENPILLNSHRPRILLGKQAELDKDLPEESDNADAGLHVESQSAARWLSLLSHADREHFDWGGEIVSAYARWSARINGANLPTDADIDRSANEWNTQFYSLFAETLMDAEPEQFEELVGQITDLPDKCFADVAETVLHSADVLYFNDATRSSDRAVELRTRMVTRVMALQRWRYNYSPGDLSIDYDTGGVVAKMLLNTHDPFNGTRSYLVPAVADRLDPLLGPIRVLQSGGPTSFVALCTMNMVLIAPCARQLDFLLAATEAWIERLPSDQGLWVTMGIGGKIVEWFETAIAEEPNLIRPDHPQRARMDYVLGCLVSVGIAEAHNLEKQVEDAAKTNSQVLG